MRLGRFESMGQKPISKTEVKDVFIDPAKEGHSVSVLKEKDPGFNNKRQEVDEKKSPRTLKGAFYLTKIAHHLQPEQVPDIHQAGETTNGQQTIDRDLNRPTKLKRGEVGEVDAGLKEIGLKQAIDPKINNYTKEAEGNIVYLDEFIPWKLNTVDRSVELNFDADALSKSIGEIEDASLKQTCQNYLRRVMVLFEEEKSEFAAHEEERRATNEAKAVSLESAFEQFAMQHDLQLLLGLETEEEALQSPERKAAMVDESAIRQLLDSIDKKYVPIGKWNELDEQYRKIAQAVGNIRRGVVDHTR